MDVAVHEVSAAAWPDGLEPKVVAMWMSRSGGVRGPMFYAVSTDGAQSWGATEPLSIEDGSEPLDPSVAVSPDGTFVAVLMATRDMDPLSVPSLYATRMPPGSQEFAQATPIEPPGHFDFPRLVAGPGDGGQTWFYIFCSAGGLYYTRSSDDGQNWEDLQQVQVQGQQVDGWGAAPVVRPDNGTIYFAYGYGDDPDPRFLRLLESTDNGVTYSDLTDLDEQTTSGHYDEFVPGTFTVPGFGRMAIDPNNPDRLYLIFNDLDAPPDPETGDGDVDVYLLRSTDGGQTWGERQRINKDKDGPQQDPAEQYDQFMPSINVDSTAA